jgi:outer membrane immunogenic protein
MKKTILAGTAAAALFLAAGAVQAADIATETVPLTDWTGFYVGGHVGYGWADMDGCFDCNDDSSALDASDLELEGIAIGIHAGYSWEMDNIVFGIEGDVTFTDFSDDGEEPDDSSDLQHGDVDLLASVRGRLGFLVTEDVLAYATGGIAIPEASWDADDPDGGPDFDDIGGVVGGGVEMAVSEHFHLRAEGLYYFFNDSESIEDLDDAEDGEEIELEDAFVIRAGISFYFN